MRYKRIAALMGAVLLTFPAAAEGTDTLRKTAVFTADSQDAVYTFEQTITEGGQEYQLSGDIAYTVQGSKPVMEPETLTHTVQSAPMYGQSMTAERTVTVDGLTYTLQRIDYAPAKVPGRSMEVSAYTEWPEVTAKPEPPQTKEAAYHDDITGKDSTAVLPLVQLRQTTDLAWRPNEDIPVAFEVYDAEYYKIGEKYAPYNADKPALKGYEAEILGSLGLDTSLYAIDDIAWTGEPYTKDGTQYRDAIATGRKYCATYRAEYADTVPLEDADGYVGTAVYTTERMADSGKMEYQIEAAAVYKPVPQTITVDVPDVPNDNIEDTEPPASLPVIIGTSAAAVSVVGIFLFLWFRRNSITVKQDGKTVYRSRVKRGSVYLDRVANGGISGTVVEVKKWYTRSHGGQELKFVVKGKVVSSCSVSSKDSMTVEL